MRFKSRDASIIAYVISQTNLPESLEAASRTIRSGKLFGVNSISLFDAITPGLKLNEFKKATNLDFSLFLSNEFSRAEPAIACFASHYTIWRRAMDLDQPHLILEHDAVFVRNPELNSLRQRHGIVNLGKPSFGRYRTPRRSGTGRLISKVHLPGAHAYVIFPWAARALVNQANKQPPAPTDVFINLKDFPWIHERYPWPVESHDRFSTIQTREGAVGKHNFEEGSYSFL